MYILNFRSKNCKNEIHRQCHGTWEGLGFQCQCECLCHKEKNKVAVGFRGPNSAALNNTIDEEFSNGQH
jgi:hypothetical protein